MKGAYLEVNFALVPGLVQLFSQHVLDCQFTCTFFGIAIRRTDIRLVRCKLTGVQIGFHFQRIVFACKTYLVELEVETRVLSLLVVIKVGRLLIKLGVGFHFFVRNRSGGPGYLAKQAATLRIPTSKAVILWVLWILLQWYIYQLGDMR